MDFIKNLEPIVICDIGASPINKTEFIDKLFNNSNSKIIGFEPNIDQFNKLKKTDRKKYFNLAIGDGNEHELNICNAPGMTSFLEPNLDYLKLFHGFKEWSKIKKKEKIKTIKLDDLDDKIDFIKIDVQGFESEVIKFGNEKHHIFDNTNAIITSKLDFLSKHIDMIVNDQSKLETVSHNIQEFINEQYGIPENQPELILKEILNDD